MLYIQKFLNKVMGVEVCNDHCVMLKQNVNMGTEDLYERSGNYVNESGVYFFCDDSCFL